MHSRGDGSRFMMAAFTSWPSIFWQREVIMYSHGRLSWLLLLLVWFAGCAAVPADNPVAHYRLPWTDDLKWSTVVTIADFPGETVDQQLAAAQAALAGKGGGTVYFPAGTYRFAESIKMQSNVILRGATPRGVTDARDAAYEPLTRFIFPAYKPVFEGAGTPNETAFKGIHAADPATASNVAVVNIAVDHGHIHFNDGPEKRSGRNRVVFGCVLKNAAQAAVDIPDVPFGQHAWQRFTRWHGGEAIRAFATENVLVANNRIPPSDASFLMPGYVIEARKDRKPMAVPGGEWFDYDNRGGIAVNSYPLGGSGNSPPDGTPETHPWGFRKGTVIRDNYIYCTGRSAIAFSGDGAVCSFNVIRFKKDVVRWTNTGKGQAWGSSTNDNRAATVRGWRWTLEGNDYEVYRNKASDSPYYINDGEGLMHEDHANSTIVDSKMINNKGNAYLCIYMTGGIDGLEVRGNDIRSPGGFDIFVVASRVNPDKKQPWFAFPCRNVSIVGNVTGAKGIRIEGAPAGNNRVEGNRHVGAEGVLVNAADAVVKDNVNYKVQEGTGRAK